MGVVFFPSLPFMGVMLFPSFVLGNVSGEGGTLLVPLSLFSILLSIPLFFFSFSFSFILSFLPHLILPFLFSYAQSLSIPFFFFSYFPPLSFPSPLFFFFEGTACTMYFQDVTDDTTDCSLIGIYRDFSFWSMIFHILLYGIFLSVLCLHCLQSLIK